MLPETYLPELQNFGSESTENNRLPFSSWRTSKIDNFFSIEHAQKRHIKYVQYVQQILMMVWKFTQMTIINFSVHITLIYVLVPFRFCFNALWCFFVEKALLMFEFHYNRSISPLYPTTKKILYYIWFYIWRKILMNFISCLVSINNIYLTYNMQNTLIVMIFCPIHLVFQALNRFLIVYILHRYLVHIEFIFR